MQISGLQKLTLLDFPNRIACTIFTCGCQFKCPFCQNSSLVFVNEKTPLISEEEIFEFLKTRVGILDGVCITGGEPTLQKDLKDLIKKIKNLGFLVKLDTNGYRPEVLKELLDENLLDYVAVDIKNSYEKYGLTTGVKNLDTSKIDDTIRILLSSSIKFEFRTTVVKEFHEMNDFAEIAKIIKGVRHYYLQQFRDSESCIQSGLHAYSKEELDEIQKRLESYGITTSIRGID